MIARAKKIRVGHHIFISYAEEDKAVAERICRTLEAEGVICWIAPRDIVAGKTWAGSIIDAIESAAAVVVVLSASSIGSRQVAREVERADNASLPILSFRVDKAELAGDLEYFLSSTQWLDASSEGVDASLARLTARVRETIANPAIKRPQVAAARVSEGAGRGRVSHEFRHVAAVWFNVVARGHAAVDNFGSGNQKTAMFAFRFAAYMLLTSAVVSCPLSEAGRRNPLMFTIAYTISSAVELLGAALIAHWCFRAVGGRGPLRRSTVVICVCAAYLPLLSVAVAPVNVYLSEVLRQSGVADPEILKGLAANLRTAQVAVAIVSFVASSWLVLALVRAIFGGLRQAHGVRTATALFAMLMVAAGYAVFLVTVAFPFARAVYV